MEEAELIKALKRRDENAYRYLYREYAPRIGGLARTYMAIDDVEDVVQEVMIRVFKSIKKFRGDSKLSTWIYRISVNVCNTMIQKNHVKKEIPTDFPEDEDDRANFHLM